jgi:CHASE2 domain-containing sensor protein
VNDSHWTNTLTKATWTIMFAAVGVFVAWQLLKQLVVPLLVVVCLICVLRLALGVSRRDGW